MCLNCGCGEPDERHQPTDITLDDVRQAATGSDIPLDETIRNLQQSLEDASASAGSAQ
jgi:hypothetical protein